MLSDHILPSAFREEMKALLPKDFEQFEAALNTAPPVSIRRNPGKIPVEELTHLPLLNKIEWHPDGYYLSSRPVFTLDPLFHAGAYYVQEASSMFLHEALQQTTGEKRPLRILDLCAAPGGKTTLIASWMPEGSMLIANEVIKSRVGILKQNLIRWGQSDVFTCSYDPEAFLPLAGWFDLVVVDAPCSGEGLFRKNELSHLEWSPENVALCSARQKRILHTAHKLVAPGGTLIYSTGTYNQAENDLNARWLVKEKEMLALPLDIPAAWNISERSPGYQMYPHKVKGEGFYIAAFKKLDPVRSEEKKHRGFKKLSALNRNETQMMREWISDPERYLLLKTPEGEVLHAPPGSERSLIALDHLLPHGVWLHEAGQIKGRDFIPAHSLALHQEILSAAQPILELNEHDALQYLKKELGGLPPAEKGWLRVAYKNLPLGWVRNLGNRFNNYFPTEQRIRMKIGI